MYGLLAACVGCVVSHQVADINLAAATVGQIGSIPPAGGAPLPIPPATITQQMQHDGAKNTATLVVFNESGCRLKLILPNTSQSITLPAGRWVPIALPPTETFILWQVQAIAPSSIFHSLVADYYGPGEPVDPLGVLGNSPIGGSVSTPSSPANSFEQDLFSAWVLTGLVCTKDVSVANQLDVTGGIAFLTQADSSVGRVATSASTFLTSAPSSTYFLDLNPDGSFSFGTSHSVVSGHLTICSLTTDASGNILVVTDARTLNTTMLSAMLGSLAVPPLLGTRGGRGILGTLAAGDLLDVDSSGNSYLKAAAAGTINFQIPSGTSGAIIGSTGGFTRLGGQNTAGNFGVPLNVGQTLPPVNVTGTLAVNVLQITAPVTGLYRVSGTFTLNNGTSGQKIDVDVAYHDGNTGASVDVFMSGVAGAYTIFSGSSMGGTVSNQTVPLNPIDIYAQGGQLIKCFYQDLGGTPNDFVTFVIERLG